jgi:transcriptional regulator with XRE-family HTH domain
MENLMREYRRGVAETEARMGGVGQEIKRLREARGWIQAKLAVEAGMAPSAVNQIENGKRSPSASSLNKLARALGVEVANLFPKGQAPLPEQPPTADSKVRAWLKDHGAKFALMTEAEFSELVLSLEAGQNGDQLLEGLEHLIEEITREDWHIERALMQEFRRGEDLFPNPPAGPDLTKRYFARHKAVTRLQRALAADYQVLRRSLTNYSMRLYSAGRTSDFLVHPRQEATLRRQLLEEAFAEESAA